MADLTTLKDFTSIITVYNDMHKNIMSQSLIGIAIFIAVIVVAKKFIHAYKEAFGDSKPANVKHFFELFHIYLYTIAIVVTTPVAFRIIEKALGEMQNEYISRYSFDVDMAADQAADKYVADYMKEELSKKDKTMISVGLSYFWAGAQKNIYTALLYATKYLFYFFAAGRYLYLILLEIVAPLAIVSFLDDKLRHYGENYLKHLLVCYLMIPAFLLANRMGVMLGQTFIESLNSFSILALLSGFVFKLGLLKKAQSYVEKLL